MTADACASLIILALGLGFAPAAAGQVQAADQPLSASDCSLLAAYRSALARVETQAAAREEILRQLRAQPPLALVEGYWASPVDLLHLFDVAAGLDRASFAAAVPQRPGAPRDLVAFAFTAHRLRERVPLPYVGDFANEMDPAAGDVELVVVPVKDATEVVSEYLPPPIQVDEDQCYYFCGDPSEWDFDRDGQPNAADPDDDGDTTPDDEDAYPYWTGGSSCECGDRHFVGFMEKFSSQVTALILKAYDEMLDASREARGVSIDPGAGDELGIRFALPLDRCEATFPECPDANAPGVRYVSDDPDACARLRFSCEQGQEGFSNACGCGCKPPK